MARRIATYILKGKDEVSGPAKHAEKSLSDMDKTAADLGDTFTSMDGMMVAATGAAVALGAAIQTAVVAGLGEAIKSSIEFESQMARINTLLSSESNNALSAVSESVNQLRSSYGLAMEDVTGATFDAISAGIKLEDQAKFMDTAARAAVGGFSSLSDSVSGLTTIINAWNLNASEAKDVTDALFTTNKLGITTFGDLARNIGTTARSAAESNISYQELLASTAALTQQMGGRTSQAMTGLAALIDAVRAPTEQAKKSAKTLGVQWDETVLQTRGVTGAMEEFRKALSINREEAFKLIGSQEALRTALILASSQGVDKMTEALVQMNGAMSATDEAYSKAAETTSQKWNQTIQKAGVLAEGLAVKVLPAMNHGLDLTVAAMHMLEDPTKRWDLALAGVMSVISPLVGGTTVVGMLEVADAEYKAADNAKLLGDSFKFTGDAVQFAMPFLGSYKVKLDAISQSWMETLGFVKKANQDIPSASKKLAGPDVDEDKLALLKAQADAMERLAKANREFALSQLMMREGEAAPEEDDDGLSRLDAQASARERLAQANREYNLSMEAMRGEGEKLVEVNDLLENGFSKIGAQATSGFFDVLTNSIAASIEGEKTFAQVAKAATGALLKELGKRAIGLAVFELGEGWAAVGRYDYASAGAHFTAAAVFGTFGAAGVAAGAALSANANSSDSKRERPTSISESSAGTTTQAVNSQNVTVINQNISGSLIRERELGAAMQDAQRSAQDSGMTDTPRNG